MKSATAQTITVSFASVFSRLSVLLFLSALGHSLVLSDFQVVLFVSGVGLATQVVLDPASVGVFLVQTNGRFSGGSSWRAGFVLAISLTLPIVLAPLVAAALATDQAQLIWLGLALGIMSACESICRYARWVWQAKSRFAYFAGVDIAIGLSRIITSGAVMVWNDLELVSLLIVTLSVMLAGFASYFTNLFSRTMWSRGERVTAPRVMRGSLPFFASVAMSAGYSQIPTILLGIRGSVASAAVFTAANRFTQPTEFLPSAIGTVMLPRLLRAGTKIRKIVLVQMSVAGALGLVVAGSIYILMPIGARILNYPIESLRGTLEVLLLCLPFKFINYQLVVLAVATGRILNRLVVTGCVSAAAIVLIWSTSKEGSVSTAYVVLGSEISLTILLLLVSVPTLVKKGVK